MADAQVDLKLNAQTGAFEKALGGALGSFNKFTGGIFAGGNIVTAFATGITALGGTMTALAVKTAKTADDILKLSDMTGIAVENLSLWRDVVSVSDSNMETLSKGLVKLQQTMGDAAEGAKKQKEAFEAAGIAIADSDGQLRKTEDVLLDIADVFAILPEGPTKTSLAFKLFGKSGVELIPFLSNGSKGIQELSDKFEGMGRLMSGQLAQDSSEFNDQMDFLKIRAKGLGETIGSALIPKLRDMLQWIDESLESERGFLVSEADVYEAMIEGNRSLITGKKEVVEKTNEQIEAERKLSEQTKKNIDLFLSKETREKEAAEAAKAAAAARKEIEAEIDAEIKESIDALNVQLELKRGFRDFDAEYFKFYSELLHLQGLDNEIIQLKIAQDIQSRAADAGEAETDYSDLTIKELERILDAETTTAKQRDAAGKELSKKKQAVEEKLAEGIRDVIADGAGDISKIWEGTGESFEDTWKNAAQGFIEQSIQMVIQHGIASAAIQIQTAAMTAGITILIGLMAKVFGRGKGDKNSEVEQAKQKLQSSLDSFLDSIDSALDAFLRETTSTLANLERKTEVAKVGLEDLIELTREFDEMVDQIERMFGQFSGISQQIINEIVNAWTVGVRTKIIENLEEMSRAIQERYDLEKRLINEVRQVMEAQADFARDIQGNITEVARALLSPEELFQALLGDVATLQDVVASTTGEAQIEALRDLQEAFNAVFSQAQDLFSADPEELARWQDFVLEGLEGIRDAGAETFDNLIEAAVAQLNLTQRTNDLTADILRHEQRIDAAQYASLLLLREIAQETDSDAILDLVSQLIAQLGVLGITPDVALGHGGLVRQPTTALLAERGIPELVTPLDKIGEVFGGTTTVNISLSLPNVNKLSGISIDEAEFVLKTVFTRAAENLNRSGYTWPMRSRANV